MHVQGSVYQTIASTSVSIEDLRHTPSEAVLVTKCLQAPSDTRYMTPSPSPFAEDESLTSGDMASVASSGSAAGAAGGPAAAATPRVGEGAAVSAAACAQRARAAACGSVSMTLGSLTSDVDAPRNVLPTGWLMFEVRARIVPWCSQKAHAMVYV